MEQLVIIIKKMNSNDKFISLTNHPDYFKAAATKPKDLAKFLHIETGNRMVNKRSP